MKRTSSYGVHAAIAMYQLTRLQLATMTAVPAGAAVCSSGRGLPMRLQHRIPHLWRMPPLHQSMRTFLPLLCRTSRLAQLNCKQLFMAMSRASEQLSQMEMRYYGKPQETPIKSRVAVLESEFGVGSDEMMSMPSRIESSERHTGSFLYAGGDAHASSGDRVGVLSACVNKQNPHRTTRE